MRILLVVDRGNSGSKFLPIIEDVVGEPFKIPSVTRKVNLVDQGLKIEKTDSVFLWGESAMHSLMGKKYTPLDENDKIRDLSVVVAAALVKLVPDGGPIELSLCVSSPTYYKGIEQEVIKELAKLDGGFSYEGRVYSVLLDKVAGFQEGIVFLENNQEFNGVIDLGQGTLLTGVRYPNRGVMTLHLSGNNVGGCNLILQSLLTDARFLKAVKAEGFASPPSFEKLSALLSQGRWQVKGIDFKKFLKPHLNIPKERIENAAQSIRAELRNASPYEEVDVRIAFIGGGSSLMQGVLGEMLDKWCERHNLVMYTNSPDYQTVLQMYESLQRDSTCLVSATCSSRN